LTKFADALHMVSCAGPDALEALEAAESHYSLFGMGVEFCYLGSIRRAILKQITLLKNEQGEKPDEG